MTRTPRYWSQGQTIHSMFMELTIPEAWFQLKQLRWLARNDQATPHAYQMRRADLVRALRTAMKHQRESV